MGRGSKPSGLVTGYLVLYNALCTAGWFYVLCICASHVANGTHRTELWSDVELPLKVVQTAACMEVLHSLLGLVKSPWLTTLMQVFSRVWTLWAVMDVSPSCRASSFFVLACTSWALVEVPRYLFYAMNLLDMVPYPLFWLRYSLFAILYPTGITGEIGCMYFGCQEVLKNSNKLLFGLIVIVALTYIPGAPQMYGHMVKTRGKQFKEYRESSKKKKSDE